MNKNSRRKKKKTRKREKTDRGVTVIEVLVGIGIVSLVIISLYQAFFLAVKTMGNSKLRIGAIALATEKMEMVRNLEYENIGIQSWVPNGPFIQEETVTKNGFPYLVKMAIEFVDDPFEGVAPVDTVESDYKRARVEVAWSVGGEPKSVVFFSNFVPNGLESDVGGGVLSVNVTDTDGNPLVDARVQVDSVEDTPAIHGYSDTDDGGNVRLPGMPEQLYKITVSKEGYETVTTYPNPPDSAFNPVDPHIFVDGLTVKTFIVEHTASISILAADHETSLGVPGLNINITGGRLIGTDPDTFSTNEADTTDSAGSVGFSGLNPGGYSIVGLENLETTTHQYVGSDTAFPLALSAGETHQVNILFAPKETHSLLIEVISSDTGEIVSGATVEVTATDFSQSANTSIDGKAFFPLVEDPPVVMEEGDYEAEITATGFQPATQTVAISGLTEATVTLTPQ